MYLSQLKGANAVNELWAETIKEIWSKGEWTLKGKGKHRVLNISLNFGCSNPFNDTPHKALRKTMLEEYKKKLLEGYEEHKEKYLSKFDYDYHKRLFHWQPYERDEQEFDQIVYIIETIKKDKFTNQAAAVLWSPPVDETRVRKEFNKEENASPPCFCFLQAIPESDNKLNFFTLFRSHDAFYGAPYNFYAIINLFKQMSKELDRKPNYWVHTSTSYHLYENIIQDVRNMLKVELGQLLFSKPNP